MSFFPHSIGDLWQYRSAFTNQVVYTPRVINDSLLNGFLFIQLEYESGETWWAIDTMYNVWEAFNYDTIPILHYKLDAEIEESWAVNQYMSGDSARVMDIYPSIVFGKDVIVKKIDYWTRFEFGDSLWNGTDYLATGFGSIQYDVEPSDIYYLSGAIIDSIKYGTVVGVDDQNQGSPNSFYLYQNYPNPFNPNTTIEYYLDSGSNVTLIIYNLLGEEVAKLVEEYKTVGNHKINFNARNLPSGIYFYRLQLDNFISSKKMLLLK